MKGHAEFLREHHEEFAGTISRDFFGAILGPRLGGGVFREVFRCAVDPRYVVKFETRAANFSNVIEWETWAIARYQDAGAWLAPCLLIGGAGSVLVQRYAEDVRFEELPDRIPRWAQDTKLENWGRVDGRVVLRDYGGTLMLQDGFASKAMKALPREDRRENGGYRHDELDAGVAKRMAKIRA